MNREGFIYKVHPGYYIYIRFLRKYQRTRTQASTVQCSRLNRVYLHDKALAKQSAVCKMNYRVLNTVGSRTTKPR